MSKNTWREYFTFSKKERVAVTILFMLLLLFVVLPFFYPYKQKKIVVDTKLQQQLASLTDSSYNTNKTVNDQDFSNNYQPSSNTPQAQAELFKFDPNTLNEEGLKSLGIRDRTVKTILNYRNKGGRFRQPEDIQKIYGLSKQEADRLLPYIQIKQQGFTQNESKKTLEASPYKPPTYRRQYEIIDINTATVEQWKALPGIGGVLSNRIVKFRNKLGGFTSIEQLKQTYGLPDSTFQLIQPYLKITATQQ